MTTRESGFYRVMWEGQFAVGFLHKPDEPAPTGTPTHQRQRWSLLLQDSHAGGAEAVYAVDIPEDQIGERIEWMPTGE